MKHDPLTSNKGVAKILLERGADPVERDAERWARPRAWAAKIGHPGIVELLC
jgi:hypothetical protein